MPVPNTITRTLDLAHPIDRVWAALTTAEGLGGWFGDRAEIDLRAGGEALVHWPDGARARLWIQVVEPMSMFAWTWGIEGLPDQDPRRTYVEFTLTAMDSGTRLSVVETGFAQVGDESGAQAYEANVGGWRSELGELREYLDAA